MRGPYSGGRGREQQGATSTRVVYVAHEEEMAIMCRKPCAITGTAACTSHNCSDPTAVPAPARHAPMPSVRRNDDTYHGTRVLLFWSPTIRGRANEHRGLGEAPCCHVGGTSSQSACC